MPILLTRQMISTTNDNPATHRNQHKDMNFLTLTSRGRQSVMADRPTRDFDCNVFCIVKIGDCKIFIKCQIVSDNEYTLILCLKVPYSCTTYLWLEWQRPHLCNSNDEDKVRKIRVKLKTIHIRCFFGYHLNWLTFLVLKSIKKINENFKNNTNKKFNKT